MSMRIRRHCTNCKKSWIEDPEDGVSEQSFEMTSRYEDVVETVFACGPVCMIALATQACLALSEEVSADKLEDEIVSQNLRHLRSDSGKLLMSVQCLMASCARSSDSPN